MCAKGFLTVRASRMSRASWHSCRRIPKEVLRRGEMAQRVANNGHEAEDDLGDRRLMALAPLHYSQSRWQQLWARHECSCDVRPATGDHLLHRCLAELALRNKRQKKTKEGHPKRSEREDEVVIHATCRCTCKLMRVQQEEAARKRATVRISRESLHHAHTSWLATERGASGVSCVGRLSNLTRDTRS